MLKAEDLAGVDAGVATRVIATAVSIAPCLDSLAVDDPRRARALAVLRAVAAHGAQRGSATVRGQRVGSAGVDYQGVGSWFSDDDRAALEAIEASVKASRSGLPVGRFPAHGLVAAVWPEVPDGA